MTTDLGAPIDLARSQGPVPTTRRARAKAIQAAKALACRLYKDLPSEGASRTPSRRRNGPSQGEGGARGPGPRGPARSEASTGSTEAAGRPLTPAPDAPGLRVQTAGRGAGDPGGHPGAGTLLEADLAPVNILGVPVDPFTATAHENASALVSGSPGCPEGADANALDNMGLSYSARTSAPIHTASKGSLPTLAWHWPDKDPTPQDRRTMLKMVQRHFQDEHLRHKKSIRECGRGAIPGENVAIAVSEVEHPDGTKSRLATYRRLKSCGSSHQCLYCARRKGLEAVKKIRRAAAGHLERGGACWLVTLTIPRSPQDTERELLKIVKGAWKRLTQGRAGRHGALARGRGARGYHRIIEVSMPPRGSGRVDPHVHVHLLVYAKGSLMHPGGLDADGLGDSGGDWRITTDAEGRTWRESHTICPGDDYARELESRGVLPVSGCSAVEAWIRSLVDGWIRAVQLAAEAVTGKLRTPVWAGQSAVYVGSGAGHADSAHLARYLGKAALGVGLELGLEPAVSDGQGRSVTGLWLDVARYGDPRDLELLEAHWRAWRGMPVLTRSDPGGRRDPEKWPGPSDELLDVTLPRRDGYKVGEPVIMDWEISDWLYRALVVEPWRPVELLEQVERAGPEAVGAVVQRYNKNRPFVGVPASRAYQDLVGELLLELAFLPDRPPV